MHNALQELRLDGYRNFQQFTLECTAPWTGIVGKNGTGKTNLLEAVHFLCRLRGFRGETWSRVRPWDRDDGGIAAHLGGPMRERRVTFVAGGCVLREDGDAVASQRRWVSGLPLFGYRPDDDHFFHEAPASRRAFLDWACAYTQPDYIATAARYERALRQRNALLKQSRGDAEHLAWEDVLAQAGAALMTQRERAAAAIAAHFHALWTAAALPPAAFTYVAAGSATADAAAQRLRADRDSDAERGWTAFGPHRDDVALAFAGRPIKDSGSQGFRKMAVIFLAAACALAAPCPSDRRRLFYLDDIEGELDDDNEARLFATLGTLDLQVLLTGVRVPPGLRSPAAGPPVQWVQLA